MSGADAILSRVDKVRARGPGQWSARCPAHEDKAPSLSIKELPDGRILLHCFGGCDVQDVIAAIGLEVSDLFPPTDRAFEPVRRPRLLPAGQALEILDFEAQLIALCAANIANGVELTDADRDRCRVAAGRIGAIASEVRA
ncbi:MAG: DNA primase [Pseudomonadota bacterium]